MSENTSSYLEQIRRMREARSKDENPIVAALNKFSGVRAWVNDAGAEDNRRLGDVLFVKDTIEYGIESQVSRKYQKFSYSADKIGKYEGDFVLLGCLERDEMQPDPSVYSNVGKPLAMLFVILDRNQLEGVLCEQPKGVFYNENNGRPFYTIYPTVLASCGSAVFGSDIQSVVNQWAKTL